MFLPAFWLLVPGAIGLIGITEIVGENADAGSENFLSALVSVPSIALGILVGTMIVRAGRALSDRALSPKWIGNVRSARTPRRIQHTVRRVPACPGSAGKGSTRGRCRRGRG
jgi:hypothetical protein